MPNSYMSLINEDFALEASRLRADWYWVEDRSILHKDKQEILTALDAAAAGRGYYIKADVRPAAIKAYLSKICLISAIYGEAGEKPVDGIIRLVGTWLELFYGYHTGRKLSETPVPAVGQRQLKAMQAVWEKRQPGRSIAFGHKHEGTELVIDALYVPLMDKGGHNLVEVLIHVDILPASRFKLG